MPAARRIVIAEMAKLRALGLAIEPIALAGVGFSCQQIAEKLWLVRVRGI